MNEPRDILSDWKVTALVYWLPTLAMVLSSSAPVGQSLRTGVWVAALTIMGMACLANAVRCGRIHCFLTGPFFLIMAAVTLLHGLDAPIFGSLGWNLIATTTLGGGLGLYCLPELLLGKYRGSH